ncbi:MAG: hypothetical protein HY318_07335 [Armatimonadetes bacterium]|nr:hypothetical protein [Armatimonadota bacterium]
MADNAAMVSIPETEAAFPNEWLAFEVMDSDERGFPLRGRLIAHAPRRAPIEEAVLEAQPDDFYVVWTGERPPKGMAYLL